MITVRRSQERGQRQLPWLHAKYSFSFAEYFDANFLGFRHLRVINEDVIAPGKGFAMHEHQDMEIISYIIQGELKHEDSMGNTEVLSPGQIQRMSAGTGVRHSEYNPNASHPTHMLQIWVTPAEMGLPPSYEQQSISQEPGLHLIVSPTGGEGVIKIHQDIKIHKGLLKNDSSLSVELPTNRYAWIQVIAGELAVNYTELHPGDGAAVHDVQRIGMMANSDCEFLLFDLN